jgi:hypothetical protein
MILTIDWGFWGVIVGIAAVVIGAVVAIALYLRNKEVMTAVTVSVKASFDRTGLVHALIQKKGQPVVHVRDVKVLQANTEKVLEIRSRDPAGDFDISGAGSTAKDCFILLEDARSADQGVDVQVWLDANENRVTTATPSKGNIKVPDGVKLA